MRGTGTRGTTRKPRQHFGISKGQIFLFMWLSMSHIKRKWWALFVPLKIGQVASALENKIIGKRKAFLNQKAVFSLSSLRKFRSFLPLSRSLLLLLLLLFSPIIVAQQSSNLCTPFLLQIVKGRHFRSREAHLYMWDFEISGLGRLLSHLIFTVNLASLIRISFYFVMSTIQVYDTSSGNFS